MYKVIAYEDRYSDQVSEMECEDWTEAQDEAVRLLESGMEWVDIMQDAGLLQQLNLKRGIVGTFFSTHVLAPYYVRLRNYGKKN